MASRLKNLGKLTLLLGLPVAVVAGLFTCGVYVGHEHRATVLAFERDWLGLDVTVPGEPPKPEPAKSEPAKTEPAKTEPAKTEPKPEPAKTEPKPEPTKTEPKPEPAKVEPTPDPPKPTPDPPKPEPTPEPAPERVAASPLAWSTPADLTEELDERLGEPVRIGVKVLVDPELAARRRDWISYVQRHVGWASEILQPYVGVELELRGVVVMAQSLRGGVQEQYWKAAEESREGHDLLLVFIHQAHQVAAEVPTTATHNAGVALVESTPGSRAPHLRGLLFAVGQALGAAPLFEGSEGWDAGSWMGKVGAGDDVAVTLDPQSRATMLERKHLEFSTPSRSSKRKP